LLKAITYRILDVLDIFCRRKNVRLGVNGSPCGKYGYWWNEKDGQIEIPSEWLGGVRGKGDDDKRTT